MPFVKPEVNEVYKLLARHGALVVHFSGAKGSEDRAERLFPSDLLAVIDGGASGGVSCSTVTNNDSFNSSWGSIGVIVGMTCPHSLVAVHPRDCGSREETVEGKNVRVVEQERDLSIEDLDKSIVERERDGYNEWVVRDFRTLGIFVQPPCVAEVRPGEAQSFSLLELARLFPDQSVYAFKETKIFRLLPAPAEEINHTDIYR